MVKSKFKKKQDKKYTHYINGKEVKLNKHEHYHVRAGEVTIYCIKCGNITHTMAYSGYCETCAKNKRLIK